MSIKFISKTIFSHKITCLICAVLIKLFLVTILFPQDSSNEEPVFQSPKNLHQWGVINAFHGLPSERINAIAQTNDGFLWFGTEKGLAKFNGRRVQTITNLGLSSLRISALEISENGKLWIGTENGAFYFSEGNFRPIPQTNEYSISSIFVEKKSDLVWFADKDGKIFTFPSDDPNEQSVQIIFEESNPAKSITKIGNRLFLGTQNKGLLRIQADKSKVIATNPRPFFINALAKDENNNLWIGANSSKENSGLFVAEKLPTLKVIGSNLGTVNAISFDKANNPWVGTKGRGAYFFKGQEFLRKFTFENTSGGLRSNTILTTFVDREGVVWFGTDKGVNRFDPKSPRNEQISDNKESNFVRGLFKRKNGKIIAGTNRGLFTFDEKSNKWISVKGFERQSIYTISEDKTEELLIGSPAGLFSIENNSIKPIIEDETIRAIQEFQNKTYISLFGKGLKELKNDDDETENFLLKKNVISLYNENDETLWIGTIKDGVYLFDGNEITPHPELNELKNIAIRSITGSSKTGIWFATDEGLFLYKDGKPQIVLSEKNVRNVIVKIDENQQIRVWCAASNGLFSITYDKNFNWVYSRLDIEQGFSSQNVFAILPVSDSLLLIGTNRGVVRYETSTIRPFLTPTRILSQRLHQPFELKNGIKLQYPQNSLSIEVSAVSSRTFSEQFQYSFLLYNSQNTLIRRSLSNDPQFLMEKLQPDDYRVEILAFDKDLLASDLLSFSFTVEKAPFPLAATILGVLLLIAIGALIWAILSQRKIFQTSKELAQTNKKLNNARLDLANEAERERHRISRDLHDQTLADLRHLLLIADEVPSEKATEFRTEIENVSDEIRRICEDLSPSVLENIGFAAALEWALGNAVEQISSETKIEFEFIPEENLEETLNLSGAEQIQIYRIAQEVLNNIVRHSEATKIKMSAKSSHNFVLTIEDNGKGFNPKDSKNKKGRGLSNIKARASLIKARTAWKSAKKGGTIFTLSK